MKPLVRSMRGTHLVAALLFLAVFLLYVATAAPQVTLHDSGELISAGWTLGIPHPPGAPTWCMLAHLFTGIPIGSAAYRVHLMSAFFAALTTVLLYGFVVRALRARTAALPAWYAVAAGLVSALVLAQAPAFWEKAVKAELYALNAFFLMLILSLYAKWCDAPARARLLVLIALLFGLGSGNYLALLYFPPVLLAGALWRKPTLIREWKLIGAAIAAFCLGLAVYLYVPLRSAVDPPIDWGNPENAANLAAVLSRRQWGQFTVTANTGPFILHWLGSYAFLDQLGPAAIVACVPGVLFLAGTKKHATLVAVGCFCSYAILMTLMQSTTPVLLYDLGYVMRYGMQEFHIPLYLLAAVFAGPGLYAVVAWLDARKLVQAKGWRAKVGLAVLVVLWFGVRLPASFQRCNHRAYFGPYAYGKEALRHVPQGAGVVPGSDSADSILIYLKVCERYREDVQIITPTHKYPAELVRLCEDEGRPATDRSATELLAADPAAYMHPKLNQQGLRPDASLVFVSLPRQPGLRRLLAPHGMVFRFRECGLYDRARQLQYWHDLLRTPPFALHAGMKREFREHMTRVLNGHAVWHYLQGDYDAAKTLSLRIVDYSPQEPAVDADIYARIADCMVRLQDFDTALEWCKKALFADATNRVALRCLGIVYVARQQYGLAEQCFRTILQLDPADAQARADLERTRGRRGPGPSAD